MIEKLFKQPSTVARLQSRAIGAILSVIESCRRLGVPVREYLLEAQGAAWIGPHEDVTDRYAHPGAVARTSLREWFRRTPTVQAVAPQAQLAR